MRDGWGGRLMLWLWDHLPGGMPLGITQARLDAKAVELDGFERQLDRLRAERHAQERLGVWEERGRPDD